MPQSRSLTIVGCVAVAAGAAVLSHALWVRACGEAWQEAHRTAIRPWRTGARTPGPAPGDAFARLRVPRLGIDTIVTEGTGTTSLSLGPGHMKGSASPGEADNCIIAGHRDGPFARLGSARRGDLVEISDARVVRRYRVALVRVVDRRDSGPLAETREPVLTLVTCYPFHAIGPAPKRLVVRCEPVDESRAL